jgi:hypothetical protein
MHSQTPENIFHPHHGVREKHPLAIMMCLITTMMLWLMLIEFLSFYRLSSAFRVRNRSSSWLGFPGEPGSDTQQSHWLLRSVQGRKCVSGL